MSIIKKTLAIAICVGSLLLASGCGQRDNSLAGRLYYTVKEIGCTRIEWTDVDGRERHHVLGQLPIRDEFSDRNVNADDNVIFAKDSKYVHSPIISNDGHYMVCLYGKPAAICLYNLETGKQEGTVNAAGKFLYAGFGSNNHELIYTRMLEDKRCHLLVQHYPRAAKDLVKTRNIVGATRASFDDCIYYSDVSPDGYTMLKRYNTKTAKTEDVLEGAIAPAFPRVGHEFVCILGGKLAMYNVFTRQSTLLADTLNITSPSWSPRGDCVAFVQNNAIFKVQPGEDPVQVVLDCEVKDVCWAKGLE